MRPILEAGALRVGLQRQIKSSDRALVIFDVEFAVDRVHSLLHIIQSIAKFPQFFEINTDAVVPDLYDQCLLDGNVNPHH